MKTRFAMFVAAAVAATSSVQAEVSVKLTKVHLCCGACVKAVESAIEKVEGATVEIDQKAGTVAVTAEDAKTTRKAVGAIGRAGFHGESDHAKIKMPNNSGVKAGKIERLELVGVHNCCGGCNKAIKAALASVEGVEADTATPKKKTLVVEGEFDGLAVITALNKAGFHVREKGAAKAARDANKKKKEAEGKSAAAIEGVVK